MGLVYENNRGTLSVDKKGAFCEVLDGVPEERSISDTVDYIGDTVQDQYPSVSQNALNNCNGDWYEWLIAIEAWNLRVEAEENLFGAFLLPKKDSYDVANLYEPKISELVSDLREKVRESTDVELITSNPDFVIIDVSRFTDLPDWFDRPIDDIDEDTVSRLEEAYRLFDGRCELDDVRGYIGAKRSMRPDRRLQMPHEGSLMKAIYTHIQTREWIIEPQGISYYAVSADLNNSDREALRTVATHSITTVDKVPEAAVDDAFILDDQKETEEALSVMLSAS
jgi:hypothetical protein